MLIDKPPESRVQGAIGFYEEISPIALIILPPPRLFLAPDLLSQGLYRFVKNLKSRIIRFI